MKKIYTLLLLLGIIQQSIFAQIENFEKIYIGNKINYGDFDFIDIINLNPCDYCPGEEQPLEDISFGYDIGAALTASALIQQARERALNQWFDRQHTVLKEEIERQLGQSFSNYNDARNTYFKFHERIGLQRNHTPIENKYNSRRLDRENKQSISLRNLKLLRLRENEIKAGNINNSSYGSFTYNGTPLDQIQSLNQLLNLWASEVGVFSDNNWKNQDNRRMYYTTRDFGGLQNYSHEIFTDLFNKQLAFYNQYDRWKQLDLMQAFLNEIRPPMALPYGYISPQTYATSQYIEDYAKNKHLNTWTADNIFHPYYYQHTTVYQIWMAREGRQEAIERATAYVQGLRDAELNRLLNDIQIKPCVGDPVPNPEIAPQYGASGIKGALHGCTRFGAGCTSGLPGGRTKSHIGIDLKAPKNSPIFALFDGIIHSNYTQNNKAGHVTRIRSELPNGEIIIYQYFHLQENSRLSVGTEVKAGDIIAYLGDSGNLKKAVADRSVDSHVHIKMNLYDGSGNSNDYSANFKNNPVNPSVYMNTKFDSDGNKIENNCN
jgi:murein DD-endopeptidase MepM/ murein hydrolase activator NlpD